MITGSYVADAADLQVDLATQYNGIYKINPSPWPPLAYPALAMAIDAATNVVYLHVPAYNLSSIGYTQPSHQSAAHSPHLNRLHTALSSIGCTQPPLQSATHSPLFNRPHTAASGYVQPTLQPATRSCLRLHTAYTSTKALHTAAYG